MQIQITCFSTDHFCWHARIELVRQWRQTMKAVVVQALFLMERLWRQKLWK